MTVSDVTFQILNTLKPVDGLVQSNLFEKHRGQLTSQTLEI